VQADVGDRPVGSDRIGGEERAGAGALGDAEVRIAQLEEDVAALAREVESLREDLRALAAAVGERGGTET
jgi:hypothetical protein